ncbi:hypothetical protein ABFX02_04G170300 [Erythranthe guttata]
MAYAAVISLTYTIERLIKHSRVSIVPKPSTQLVLFLHDQLRALKAVLRKLDYSSSGGSIIDTKTVDALDVEIREAVCELEDVIESHVLNQFLSQSDENETRSFIVDLQELKQDVDFFAQTVNKLKKAYIQEMINPLLKEKDDSLIPSGIDCFGEDGLEMVGLSDQYMTIKDRIMNKLAPSARMAVSLRGMAGIGKTTIAKKLFLDPLISTRFDRRAFVTIGPKGQFEDVLLDILKQVNRGVDEKIVLMEGEGKLNGLKRMVQGRLTESRYFIVLDDVWVMELLYQLADLFPDNNNGSKILLTTRLEQVAEIADEHCRYDIRFLDKRESWDLLCHKVFDEMPCPIELERAGKRIAENCEGLPLLIVTVAKFLSNAEKTREYWNMVANDKQNSVFVGAYDQMTKVLYPSYNYLPQHLKPCFLYMAVFPQNYKIPRSKLFNFWIVEGFLELACSPDYSANQFFESLVSCSLVLVHKWSGVMKTCSLHSSFWYLCNQEARKSKFFHGLKSLDDGLAEESLESQRRLCIRNNVLFGIKDVFDSMASVSMVRSLLCTGPYHKYPVPIYLGLKLLKILDALTIRLYEFPIEVLNQVQLTYLAITFNGKVPSSISKLWNLEYLIVNRHLSIVKSDDGNSSYLPTEIWDMKELKHLQVMGSNLPKPREGSFLPNLSTLLNVSAQSCTTDVLERIPNLQKLGFRNEVAPDNNADQPVRFFDCVSDLRELKILKCAIVNPIFKNEVASPLFPLSIFSSNLYQLNLSGFGYPWEEMKKISSLPKLEVLNLRCYAFRGPKWEVDHHEFPNLRFLLIEDTDLVHWTTDGEYCLKELMYMKMKHCYKLKEIPRKFGLFVQKIELIECNPLAEVYIDGDYSKSSFIME